MRVRMIRSMAPIAARRVGYGAARCNRFTLKTAGEENILPCRRKGSRPRARSAQSTAEPARMLRWLRNRLRPAPVLSSNEDWIDALRGDDRDRALAELRRILTVGLRPIVARRVEREADALVEDFVQETLLRVLESLDSFRGESRFTTWAHKIGVRIAFTELRRKRWEDVSLDELMGASGEAAVPEADLSERPDDAAQRRMIVEQVHRVIEENLSDRQRQAIVAIMVHGMPLEEVARRMGTNRNALYKLLHDGRKRMKAALEERGMNVEELLNDF
jgi:RNA polymerase sigma-70 factor, ECF subfamily